ncbi:hypothetical protein [Rhizobium rhizoryzae]|uniref:Lipoprotein n=1 Tax=Rhizobium rhizoryzae TaxID=451876 RepID=A0A7W6PQG8_9HYPH|nr:hypothetical protein [Rhizobium rhizoryzae]MBB4141675.1 hypothetical protein [Rhizobium rhizoryzae]
MRKHQLQVWAPLAAVLLCGCNTSDALTPKVDVGGGLHPTSPVTQAEAQRMAGSPEPQSRSFPPAPSYPAGPQNSQQAQSRAMIEGASAPSQTTVQSAPLSSPSPPPPASSQSAAAIASLPAASAAEAESIRFLPIIGAPVQAVTPLSKELGSSARAAGLTIKAAADSTAGHILKGYLSAFEDGGKVTVVYVWDVLDGTGARLNRIQGQLSTPSRGGADPWTSVPAELMQSVGQTTIKSYLEWRNSRA